MKAGDLLGRVEDFYGNPIAKYRAEGDGVVFYHAGGLLIKVGDSLAAYGLKAYCDEA